MFLALNPLNSHLFICLVHSINRSTWRTKRRFDRPSSSNAPPPSPPVLDREPWPREREGEPIETWENYTNPNEAVRHKDCTHCAIENDWDDNDSLFYNEWLKGEFARLEFHPYLLLLRNLAHIPRRGPMPQATREAAQPQPDIPDFPHIPDIPMHDYGDFQYVVVDALHAILSRVSQCHYVTRGSVRERSPSAARPSRQRQNDSDDDTDED
ncbi:hypothetical protein IGI04_007272 [Brassica rapa subsp. trilocularis]|uniref:Uncharacterized protein n=1 Tax=Brassica rapa subsp. trilocularis TaxID=1813537 RepID=A0ABQ7NJK9_BRACM|nr:hypothetical protein IGI04_007272 [Brassica rapa subsp. trilocularis]